MNARIYAVIASLVALGLVIGLWREHAGHRELAAQVTRLTRQNADLRYEVKQASKQATEVGQRAIELDSQLGTTKARTTATEARSVQLTRELTETRSRLTEREQRAVALMAELTDLRQKVTPAAAATSRGEVAAAPIGARATPPASMPAPIPVPEPAVDVSPYRERIAQLEEQLTQLLTRALTEPAVALPPEPEPVQHQVVRVGAASTFVVLDYGAEHGARPQAIIRLQRGTSELAQVQISDVRPRFSLAQVLPGTLKGQLQSGDLVVFNP
ncbi:hypothetical protein [Opitutus sp. GAS368]|uniref:hypothetical protein n=1 Tax=Opitutus sp. GAS368 TaxID=1882749 RepID=UPI00087AC748|nr:hypothetical protein [Opitutus sp. GAS368]SDS56037.1 hypothetical protein SAMN05444173_3257 [Opitutus sp. GAS368]